MNNVPISEKQFMALFEALGTNETLEDLAMANTMLTDFAAANLAASIESNKSLEKVNIESNNVSPQTLVKLFEVRILFVTLVDYCYQPFKMECIYEFMQHKYLLIYISRLQMSNRH